VVHFPCISFDDCSLVSRTPGIVSDDNGGGRTMQVAGRSLALQQAVDAAIVAELASSKPQEGSDALGRSADLSITVDSFPQKLSSSFLLMLGVPSVVPWLGPTFCCIGFATQVLVYFCFFRCDVTPFCLRGSWRGFFGLPVTNRATAFCRLSWSRAGSLAKKNQE